MGLQNVIKNATGAAFNAMGDIPQTLTIRRTEGGTYNPATGTVTGETTTDYPCRGVILDFTRDMIDGTLILAGDKQATIEAASLAVEPRPSDDLIQDGASWNIIAVDVVKPGSVPFLYKLQVRG